MRLIDADALMRDIGETILFSGKPDMVSAELRGARTVVDRIEAAPTVDAVEVVRCKDCAIPHNCWTGCPKLGGLVTPPDFFCAFGTKEWNYEKT